MNNDTCTCPKCGKPAKDTMRTDLVMYVMYTVSTECETCGNHTVGVFTWLGAPLVRDANGKYVKAQS